MLKRGRVPVPVWVALTLVGWTPSLSAEAGEWQVSRVRVNGVALELRHGEVGVGRPALAAALVAQWRSAGDATPTALAVGTRVVIGRQRGRLHETVMLRDTGHGRTHVLVAVTDLGVGVSRPPRPPLGLPIGQRVLQVVEHGGGRHAARTFTLRSDEEPPVASGRWRRALAAAGWSPRVTAPDARGPRRWVLWAERGNERLEAVFIARDDGARIVLQVTGDAR